MVENSSARSYNSQFWEYEAVFASKLDEMNLKMEKMRLRQMMEANRKLHCATDTDDRNPFW